MRLFLVAAAVLLSGTNTAQAGGLDVAKLYLHKAFGPGAFSIFNFERFIQEFQNKKYPKLEESYNNAKFKATDGCPAWGDAAFALKSAVGGPPPNLKKPPTAINDLEAITLDYEVTALLTEEMLRHGQLGPYCGTITVSKSWNPSKKKTVWGEPTYRFDRNLRARDGHIIRQFLLQGILSPKDALKLFVPGHKNFQSFKKASLLVDAVGRPYYEFAGIPGLPEAQCADVVFGPNPGPGRCIANAVVEECSAEWKEPKAIYPWKATKFNQLLTYACKKSSIFS